MHHTDRVTAQTAELKLSGKTILVAGNQVQTNDVLIKDLLNLGATVICPSLASGQRDAAASARAGSLLRPVFNLREPKAVAALRTYCDEEFGGLDAVVADFGDHDAGPNLIDTTLTDCDGVVNGRIFAHVLLARTFAPCLAKKPNSAYIFVNDFHAAAPGLGGGLRSAASAAELALAKSLALETAGRPYVYSLILSASPSAHLTGMLDAASLGTAVALILVNPSYAKGQTVIQGPVARAARPVRARSAVQFLPLMRAGGLMDNVLALLGLAICSGVLLLLLRWKLPQPAVTLKDSSRPSGH